MKKLALILLAIGLFAMGLWWVGRRRPSPLPPGEEAEMVFQTSQVANGVLIRYEDPKTPLRTLRWLQPLPGGHPIAQVATQSDRQYVVLFKDGVLQESLLVSKPAGVREGFFRLAELRDACVVEGDVVVLLYVSPDGSGEEPSLVVALDLKTKGTRWFHRARGERLAATEPQQAVVYLYGADTPPVRLPLALDGTERNSAAGARSAAKSIELPPEVQEITELKPTSAWTFLLAHKAGLSAYQGSKGWVHHPLPGTNPGWFKDISSALGGGPKTYWWQPFPGSMFRVLADGTPKALWAPEELATAEPFAKDASLLHFLGVDPAGRLWFDLAIPTETAAIASNTTAQPDPATPETPSDPAPSGAVRLEDWPTYVSQGLDRLYCWDVQNKTIQRFRWTALAVPEGFQRPANGVKLLPGSGSLMLDNGSSAWLLPLSTLPLGESSTPRQPTQAK